MPCTRSRVPRRRAHRPRTAAPSRNCGVCGRAGKTDRLACVPRAGRRQAVAAIRFGVERGRGELAVALLSRASPAPLPQPGSARPCRRALRDRRLHVRGPPGRRRRRFPAAPRPVGAWCQGAQARRATGVGASQKHILSTGPLDDAVRARRAGRDRARRKRGREIPEAAREIRKSAAGQRAGWPAGPPAALHGRQLHPHAGFGSAETERNGSPRSPAVPRAGSVRRPRTGPCPEKAAWMRKQGAAP